MSIAAIVLMVAAVMIAIEVLKPGRRWPAVPGWWGRAVLLNLVQIAAVFWAGIVWNPWMVENRIWSADWMGDIGGALIGYLVITFIYYWWHRWRHYSNFLWLWFHQVHHSAQRIEIITSFYKHPLEIIINSILSSAILYLVVGVGPTGAALAVLLTGLAELFYHWNVKTPYWLGFFVQRPESHCIHHQEGVHGFNYADLPLWDMMFGTFRNPREWESTCGLGADSELKLVEMLQGLDVMKLPAVKGERMNRVGWALLGLGMLQMFGDLAGIRVLKGVGAAMAASPAPKVFTSAKGLETFSTRFILEWEDSSGTRYEIPISRELYSHLEGPYNRRNIYGAVLAYGPVLPGNIRRAAFGYALCGSRPLLRDLLGAVPRDMRRLWIRYELKDGEYDGSRVLRMEVDCR